MLKIILKILCKVVGVMVAILAIYFLLQRALTKLEIQECVVWQSYAREYPRFYMTLDQIAQCKQHGFEIIK